jgi:hypothetical protein
LILLVRRRRTPAAGVVEARNSALSPCGAPAFSPRVAALSGRGLGDFKVEPRANA